MGWGDIHICNNTTININSDNSDLIKYLKNAGINTITLLMHSPELNAIKLTFNTMI